MKFSWTTLSLHQRLATLAVALGLLAAFSPRENPRTTQVDLGELAALVQQTDDHVSARDLADWILQGDAGYRLIDLRTEAEYAAYHIPGAECIPLTTLMDAAVGESSLLRNERIVLYSEGGIHAAQAWLLLQAAGYRSVYSLLGGLEAWQDEVLYPEEPQSGASESDLQQFAKAVEVARALGGHAVAHRAEGAAEGPTVRAPLAGSTPAVTAPGVPVPSAPASTAKPKKKKEGC
jgi:rhodanese-related sulfurtransferase